MSVFVIEDEAHSDTLKQFETLEEVVVELKKLSNIPWDQEPNQAPCSNWKNCGRRYELVEYDNTSDWNEVRRIPALNINAHAILWTPVFKELTRPDVVRDKMTKRFIEVRKILMDDWDPIGVSEAIEAEDEYDDYVNQILSIIYQGGSVKEIEQYLAFVAKDLIGLDPNYSKIEKVAMKISLLKDLHS